MTRIAVLAVAVGLAGCSRAPATTMPVPAEAATPARPAPTSPNLRGTDGRPITEADVNFMTGMIGHHAQALKIAAWAPSHGASPTVQTLAARIIVSQTDEIHFMQNWLRDRGLPVPDANPDHMGSMPGMDHSAMMPGMLTNEQLAQLDAARGKDFDRLFLTFMVQHHRGAITMVNQLIASPGAAQDDVVFKYISDVNADQTTEIDRMNTMLAAMQ